MLLREVVTILLVLIAVLIFGNLWFHLVESLVRCIRWIFRNRRDPPAWHPFQPEQDDDV